MGNEDKRHQKHGTVGQAVAVQKHDKPEKEKMDKDFCKDQITFRSDGCIYIKDPELVEAIQMAIAIHGGICIMADDPGRPGKEMNVVC